MADVTICGHCGLPIEEHNAGLSQDSFRGDSVRHVAAAAAGRAASGPGPALVPDVTGPALAQSPAQPAVETTQQRQVDAANAQRVGAVSYSGQGVNVVPSVQRGFVLPEAARAGQPSIAPNPPISPTDDNSDTFSPATVAAGGMSGDQARQQIVAYVAATQGQEKAAQVEGALRDAMESNDQNRVAQILRDDAGIPGLSAFGANPNP